MRIALLSSFNADLLPSWLAKFFGEAGHTQPTFYVSGFGRYQQDVFDLDSDFYRAQPEIVILLLDCQDLFADLIQHPFDYAPDVRQAYIERELEGLQRLTELINKRLPTSSLLINTLVAPPVTSLGLLEYNSAYSIRGAVSQYNRGLVELAQRIERVSVVDCEALALEAGWSIWNDERMWVLGRMRLSRRALEQLARRYCATIRALYASQKKVLALDADNTLWGGVIGSDGVEGIQLGHEGVGLAYRQFQAEILALQARGILLALVSKNNPEDVFEVLDTHPAMLLKREHFAALCISWKDKVSGLGKIAQELDLGLESFVFVDDDAVECAWVRDQLPEVQVLKMPGEPTDAVRMLREADAFATLRLSSEDLSRGRYYREELRRRTERAAATSLEEFYASLEMRATIQSVARTTLARVAQLTQKTNQFNLTTRRYSEGEIKALAEDANSAVYTLSLSDRYGDNGLVGVAILCWEGENARIDSLLLSCRVMGRSVETAFLAFLMESAQAHGARSLLGEYLPTRKNLPVRDLYLQHGFLALDSEGHRWRRDLAGERLSVPPYIALELPTEESTW